MILAQYDQREALVAVVAGLGFLALVAWALARLEHRRARRLAGFADSSLVSRLVSINAPWIRRPLNPLVIAGLAFLLLALAEPRWGATTEGGTRRGSRDVLVLLDASESMNAANPAPSRLARARDKIAALVAANPGDRFGLIAFSGAPVLECPLTTDHDYFLSIVQSLTTDTIVEEGTRIDHALEEALGLFAGPPDERRASSRTDRLTLLISDGEDGGAPPLDAARALSRVSTLAVLGIGDERGAEVRLPDWVSRSSHALGKTPTHWSVLDEDGLSSLALAASGVYVRSTLNGDDLDVLQREIAALEGHLGREGALPREANRYRWPLLASLVCFAGEGLWVAAMKPLGARFARRRREEVANATAR